MERTPDPKNLIVFEVNRNLYIADEESGRIFTSKNTVFETVVKIKRGEGDFYFYSLKDKKKLTSAMYVKLDGKIAEVLKGTVLQRFYTQEKTEKIKIATNEQLETALERSYNIMDLNNDPFLNPEEFEEVHVPYTQGYREQVWKEKGKAWVKYTFEKAAENKKRKLAQEENRKQILGSLIQRVIQYNEVEEERELKELEEEIAREEAQKNVSSIAKLAEKRYLQIANLTSQRLDVYDIQEPIKLPNKQTNSKEIANTNLESIATRADPNVAASLVAKVPFSYKTELKVERVA